MFKKKINLQLFAGEATKTIISDVIVPEVFNPYVIQRTAELSAFYQSGIIARTPELDRLASSGGRLLNMPFWEDLEGDDEVLSDTEALTVGKITAAQDVAALLARGRAWSVNDLAKALSGDDPMAAIGDLVADYWARRFQAILIKTLDGIFGDTATGMDTNKHDISSEDGDAAVIDAKTAIDAIYKLGDSYDKLTGFAMHSATVAKLAKADLIEYIKPSEGEPDVPTFLGKRVIVDDGSPASSGVYTTYIFGAGAFGWGEGGAPVPTETARKALAGDDILIHRRHFILHPRGVAFQNASVSGPTPSNTELANYENWKRVYEPKNVRIVQFKHKLA
ncbi:MAG: coat protein [Candidatus Wallacebacter cryptica]